MPDAEVRRGVAGAAWGLRRGPLGEEVVAPACGDCVEIVIQLPICER
jgi:hypothetical protein